jgi:thiol-disulfide isomerase/thioredoxin
MKLKQILSLSIFVAISSLGVIASATRSGERAPGFALADLEGKTVELSAYQGKIVFVDFWAHWCGPCKKELPVLEKLARRYAGKDVVFLAINVDREKKDALAFLRSAGIATLPVLLDPKSAAVEKYGPETMPSSFVIDRKGMIRFVNSGYVAGDEKKFAQQIDSLR